MNRLRDRECYYKICGTQVDENILTSLADGFKLLVGFLSR